MPRPRRRDTTPPAPEPQPVTSYDDYLYDEAPITETHPAHLAALARLFGLDPAPPQRCRVLELGCALGGNLLPMAVQFPRSQFVGLDLSAPQVAVAKQHAEALGLRNVVFQAQDILDVDIKTIGSFDYILCHGVYSWVPPAVQAKILEISGRCLTPNGVAYVSFNTYPGWHLRDGLRQLLRRAVGPQGTPMERVARAREFLRLFEHLPSTGHAGQLWLRSELEILKKVSDKYIYYEHLVDINLPSYFSEFAEAAARVGLRYVGDAHIASMFTERFGPETVAAVDQRSHNLIEFEQNLDLVEVRYFRRAVLCHDNVTPDRDVSWRRLEGFQLASLMSPASAEVDVRTERPETFKRAPAIEMETSLPILKAALVALWEQRPRGLSFREVCSRARALVDDQPPTEPRVEDLRVLGINFAGLILRGNIEPLSWAPQYVVTPGPKPATTEFIRYQASRDRNSLTNLRHESIRVDRFDRCVLQRMDGTKTWDELVTGIIEDAHAGKVTIEVEGVKRFDRELIWDVLEQKLQSYGRWAILTS